MTTIRVICTKCSSKLDIRAELAGSTRRCPKCKTEFTVPAAVHPLEEDVVLVSDAPVDTVAEDALSNSAGPESLRSDDVSAPAAGSPQPTGSDDDEEDDDDDYLPTFVRETVADKAVAKPAAKKSTASMNDDEEPVLAIPKLPPPPPRTKSQAFDPDAFLNDEPQPSASRNTPAPPTKGRAPRNRFDSEFGDEDSDVRPKRSRSTGGRDLQLPPPEQTGFTDTGVRSEGETRDRAQAARELRQALKDSALKAPEEKEARGGIAYDFSVLLSEVGIKGFAIFFGTLLFAAGLYFLSSYMLISGPKLPPLGYVSGKVTLDNVPLAGARVQFAPIQEESSGDAKTIRARTSVGVTDDQGQYKLMYQEGISGVAVGKCRVWVELNPPQVAAEYSIGMPNFKEVTAGTNPPVDFALTSVKNLRNRQPAKR